MQTATRRRMRWAILASVVAHVALAVVVVLQRPMLKMPVEDAGPPQAIIPILIMPKAPPAAAGALERPSEIRLHRRKPRYALTDVAPPPVVIPAAPVTAPPSPRPSAPHPAPQPEGPRAEVRTILRQGLVGCANMASTRLTPAERDLCTERLGRGAREAPFLDPGVGLSQQKRALFDQAAAGRDAAIRARDRSLPQGLSAGANDSSQPGKPRSFEEPPPPRLPP